MAGARRKVDGDELRSTWEAAFNNDIALPFTATLLEMPVEVRRFRINGTNTLQCQVLREQAQRWVSVEDLDQGGLPEDCRRILELYHSDDGQRLVSVRDGRRQVILERMADHILRVGLRGATLRLLAASAGTSNRMLLYYFVDKDELLRTTLDYLAQRLLRLLDSSRASTVPAPFHLLLPSLLEAMRSPAFKPYMCLWLEIAAIASREEEPYRTIAAQICSGFLAWGAACLQVEQETERASLAALLLGTVDGLSLLSAIGCGSAVEEALNSLSVYPTKEKIAKEQ